MPIWDEVITERDRRVYATAGYGQPQGLGKRPGRPGWSNRRSCMTVLPAPYGRRV